MERTPNARFWVYVNGGPVKLTLRPGQSLEHVTGGPTEEGWQSSATRWTHDAECGVVAREWAEDGRDCDGRSGSSGEDYAPYAALLTGYHDEADGVTYPVWTETEERCYDLTAEAAGY